jgi:hypothetical protein
MPLIRSVHGGARCYGCEEVPNRACVLCGRLFCDDHGGEQSVWLSEDGSTYGARSFLKSRVVCDACAGTYGPMPTSAGCAITCVVVAGVLTLAMTALFFLPLLALLVLPR